MSISESNSRRRRDDHSTNQTHPAFDGRIINGDIANIKRNVCILLRLNPKNSLFLIQNIHSLSPYGSIIDMHMVDHLLTSSSY